MQPSELFNEAELMTVIENHDRNFSLWPGSWTCIDVKVLATDSRPMRHPHWFVEYFVKTVLILSPGQGPGDYEWTIVE